MTIERRKSLLDVDDAFSKGSRKSSGKDTGKMKVRDATHLITEIVLANKGNDKYIDFECAKVRQQFFEQYRPK